jgi:hypothetical protein
MYAQPPDIRISNNPYLPRRRHEKAPQAARRAGPRCWRRCLPKGKRPALYLIRRGGVTGEAATDAT